MMTWAITKSFRSGKNKLEDELEYTKNEVKSVIGAGQSNPTYAIKEDIELLRQLFENQVRLYRNLNNEA